MFKTDMNHTEPPISNMEVKQIYDFFLSVVSSLV